MVSIGFLVNPIAGIGGKAGLKGTDGKAILEKALELGGKPIAPKKATDALEAIKKFQDISKDAHKKIKFVTCSGDMGESELKKAGLSKKYYDIIYKAGKKTTAKDTKKACEKFLKEKKGKNEKNGKKEKKGAKEKEGSIDLILFCGGDGTARDIVSVIKERVPVVGIPAGVKMYSGIFAETPEKAGLAVVDYAGGTVSVEDTEEVEIVDIDEKEYRKGNLKLRMFGVAKTLGNENIIQSTKGIINIESEEDKKVEIADQIIEIMEKEKDALFILGPGTTTEKITELLGIKKSLLGVSIIKDKKLIADDVNEKKIINTINKMKNKNKVKIVISPIGNQGFVFGRGNQQISPDVIKKVGVENIIVISTPNKLRKIDTLRVDTGDIILDKKFKGFWKVVIGYGRWRMCRVE